MGLAGPGFLKQVRLVVYGFYSLSVLLPRAPREQIIASPVSLKDDLN